MRHLLLRGPQGRTSPELEELMGMKHQTVSSMLRQMELTGYAIKCTEQRDGCHAYVASIIARVMPQSMLLPPNPPRESYQKRYKDMVAGIEHILRPLRGRPSRVERELRELLERLDK
jgi:hypothetical protein